MRALFHAITERRLNGAIREQTTGNGGREAQFLSPVVSSLIRPSSSVLRPPSSGLKGTLSMRFGFAELIGIAAAVASLYAFNSRTIIPLRVAAIIANLLAMLYSSLHGTYPTFALNAVLLPLNAWRLHAMLKLIRDIDTALRGDMNVDWLLPFTRPRWLTAGDVLMERGEYATAAFYIVAGEVEIVEIKETFGRGTLLGEIGLFAPDGRRTMTVRCKTDVQAAQIDYDQFKQLYFQNPQFGFRLLHLIVARLQGSRELVRPAVAS
jgi:CRP/FNR family transcriptional regulator, cyclic AMP receptor protein